MTDPMDEPAPPGRRATAVSIALVLAAVGGVVVLWWLDGRGDEAAAPSPHEYLLATLTHDDADGAASGVRFADRLVDLLPNRFYGIGEGHSVGANDGLLVGRIVDLEPGQAFRNGDPAAGEVDDGIALPSFDAPDAQWKSVHAVLAVDEWISTPPGAEARDEVALGLTVAPDVDLALLRDGLVGLGRIAVVTSGAYPLEPDEPALFGSLTADFGYEPVLTQIADDGELSLPLQDPTEEAALLAGLTDLPSLVAAANRPDEVVLGLPPDRQHVFPAISGPADRLRFVVWRVDGSGVCASAASGRGEPDLGCATDGPRRAATGAVEVVWGPLRTGADHVRVTFADGGEVVTPANGPDRPFFGLSALPGRLDGATIEHLGPDGAVVATEPAP